jgi:hypothetical protein
LGLELQPSRYQNGWWYIVVNGDGVLLLKVGGIFLSQSKANTMLRHSCCYVRLRRHLDDIKDSLGTVTTNGLTSSSSASHRSTISDHFNTESAGREFENSKKLQT